MKIRFDFATTARLDFEPGDVLEVTRLRPDLERLILAQRRDGKRAVSLVDNEEMADRDARRDETAVVGRGRKHAQRPTSVPE